jgi:hypothetical protein
MKLKNLHGRIDNLLAKARTSRCPRKGEGSHFPAAAESETGDIIEHVSRAVSVPTIYLERSRIGRSGRAHVLH